MKLKERIKLFFVNLLIRLQKDNLRKYDTNPTPKGIVKDTPDSRDRFFDASVLVETTEIPTKYEILEPTRIVFLADRQGYWNSCAASLATAIEISHIVNDTNKQVDLSRRFLWYHARILQGNLPRNEGVEIRNVFKAAQKIGVSPEKLCPYIDAEMNDKPAYFADGFAHMWKIGPYFLTTDTDTIKKGLFKDMPYLAGVYVNDSFLKEEEPIKIKNNEQLHGGHGIVFYGYNDDEECFYAINSWNKLLFKLPYEYWEKYKLGGGMFILPEQ